MIVFGLGLSITVAPLTATVLAAAPARHAGPASESWHRMTQLDKVVFSSTLQQAL